MSIYSERSLKKVVLLSIIVAPLFSCVQHKETLVAERENASLPYAALHRMASLAQTSGGKLIVRSKLPDVPPQAIEYTIESKNDTILLRVTQDGILDVPLSQTLLEENPLVVVNQPKGSLVIEGDFKMLRSQADKGKDKPDEFRVKYSEIFSAYTIYGKLLKDAGASREQVEKEFAKHKGYEISIPDPERNMAVIHSKKGDISVRSDSNGKCLIPYDATLMKEDPWVSFPRRFLKGKLIQRDQE